MKKRFITIKNEHEGYRLDKAIPLYLKDISRGEARRLLSRGSVYLNGKRIRSNSRLVRSGQTITVFISEESGSIDHLKDTYPTPEMIFEDKWYVVVNKPSGIPSDETKQGSSGTLTDILKKAFNYKYLQIVHRLDKSTSGLMVISKTPAATKILNKQFRQRIVKKKYVARVHGHVKPKSKRIETFLDRDPTDKRKFRSVSQGGRASVSCYKTISQMPDSTLVSVEIETGRTHQIRVHLSEAGYPIIGDRLYDGREKHTSRLLLHASYLSFVCPRTGEAVEFESTAPDEFYTDPVVPV